MDTTNASDQVEDKGALVGRRILPAVDIFEDEDGFTIEAEMPGVGSGDVRVTVENGNLALGGMRKIEQQGREAERVEFLRSFALDPSVDTAKITARMEQGLLVLNLPKAQDKKPRRILVSG